VSAPFSLGVVGHFSLAVSDPRASAHWYIHNLGLREEFTFDEGVAVGNDAVTIALFRGTPSPATLEHISFHIPDVATLRAALAYVKANGVEVEDPGDEIGPEGPGSANVGFWLHDPDGYRLELSVQGGAEFLDEEITPLGRFA
jgi:catechol 2,3-dioxygenase-like lactoylglutathione lyase family enzyme